MAKPGIAADRGAARWRGLSLLGFVLLWQLLALALHDRLLPAPMQVLQTLWAQLAQGDLAQQLAITLARVAVAFLIAMLLGTALGLWMGRDARVDAVLDGPLTLALNLPALVAAILCYVWLGLTETAAVLAVAINKLPTVVVTVREGARAFDAQLAEVALLYRVPLRRRVTQLWLPQLAPWLLAASRSGLALIWKIVLVVELVGRGNGIGARLGTLFQYFDIAGVLACTLAFAAVVHAIEVCALRPLERRCTRWRA